MNACLNHGRRDICRLEDSGNVGLHTADLGHSPLPMPSPPERRCLIFAPRLRVVCPTPDSWRAKFESSVLRGIFMDNLQAAMDAPTALNVTVQAIRRREVCRSGRPREGPASWPGAFGRGQIDTKIELGGLFNWKVGRRSWVPAAAPIGTGDDLHEVTIWIFEIDTPASIVMVYLLLFRLCGVGPISQPAFAYSPEYLVELCFTDQEGVVLRGDLFLSINKIDVCVIIGPNDLKRPPLDGPRQTQYPREKSRRRAFVARRNDRVIELDRHGSISCRCSSPRLDNDVPLFSARMVTQGEEKCSAGGCRANACGRAARTPGCSSPTARSASRLCS